MGRWNNNDGDADGYARVKTWMRMEVVLLCMQMGGWGSVECVSGGKGGGGTNNTLFGNFFYY